MLIRLVPPSPHPTILYGLTFPNVLPGATMPTAWSSQLQILTAILQVEPPSSIHMLDRAVGPVARAREVSMNILQRQIEVRFVDGREVTIPMNSDCVRMLEGVVVDYNGCSELESRRNSMNSMEGSACPGGTAGSAEDILSGGSPTKSPKLGKHKRQRSLLFSLISSLVPKSLSLSSSLLPSSGPPPAPLSPLPVAGSVTSISSRHIGPALAGPDPEIVRRQIRATLVNVWRRHVISALTLQHLPAAGYAEWILVAMAGEVRAEIESFETIKSRDFNVSSTRAGGGRHRKIRSEGRNAFDFGDRRDDCESEQWRCRAPSPFLDVLDAEDTDQVVYPRQGQADEWGVRYVPRPRSSDEVDVFAVGYNGHDDNLGEQLVVGDDWDDDERLTLELSRMGCRDIPGMYSSLPSFEDRHLYSADFGLDCSENDDHRLTDMVFDVLGCPPIPSDVNGDEESDVGQTSLWTPANGDDLPLVPSAQRVQGSTQRATCSAPQPLLVSKVSSSRPRSRNASAQYPSEPSMHVQASRPPTSSTLPSPGVQISDCRDIQIDEFIASRFAHLERICSALEVVRSRAREEGWRSVRATLIGAKNGWLDAETDRSLEIKAKRRAWSSGIKISAPYSTSCSAPKVWDGGLSTFKSPGLTSRSAGIPQVGGPVVPTGLSLGIPVRSSPLAMYVWGADDGQRSASSKYGILRSVHGMETIQGKKSSRVTFANSVTRLFPVCEDDNEDSLESVQTNAVGFPQAVPRDVSTEEPEPDFIKGLTENEADPFHFCPSWPRTRTTSMYVITPTSSAPSSPVLPMFRCTTPPPCYEAAVGGDFSILANDEEGKLDASALLLQPLSTLPDSSSRQSPSSRLPHISNPPFVSRPRAISLPTPTHYSCTNKTRRTSFNHKDEHCADLSRVYVSPPPMGPLVISATPAPHEQFPRYAHVHSPVASKKSANASVLGRTGKEVVFEQAGSGFTVGIEVALGRAEEGRVVW